MGKGGKIEDLRDERGIGLGEANSWAGRRAGWSGCMYGEAEQCVEGSGHRCAAMGE